MPKDEQLELIETDHPEAATIKRLARKYDKLRVEYNDAKEKKDEAMEKLVQAMQKANLPRFKQGDVFVEVREHDPTAKVKVGEDANQSETEDEE